MKLRASKLNGPTIFNCLKVLTIVFVSLVFVQCSKDEDPNEELNNKLNGTWDVESFRIDGVEQIQYIFTTFELEFIKEAAATGESRWFLIDINGDSGTSTYDYEITNDGMRIEMDGDEFNIEINGNFLTLDGNVGGFFWEIDAEKN